MTPDELKEFRDRHNWNQSECAKQLGVDQAQISRWERGKQPIPDWADKLVKCLKQSARGE